MAVTHIQNGDVTSHQKAFVDRDVRDYFRVVGEAARLIFYHTMLDGCLLTAANS